jgi:hypothetical protein
MYPRAQIREEEEAEVNHIKCRASSAKILQELIRIIQLMLMANRISC